MELPPDGPQRRFYDHLSPKPRWGFSKELYNFGKKENIIGRAKYIQLPNNKRQYIIIDVDDPEMIDIWDREVLPNPTIRILNPANNHQQLLFELENKIILPIVNSTIKISFKAINYFSSVSEAMREKFNGDPGYSYGAMKNPFHKDWSVSWHDERYDLNYLSDFVDLKPKHFSVDDTSSDYGRHMAMFNHARKESYKFVCKFSSYEDFYTEVEKTCWNYYYNYTINVHSSHPFYTSQVNSNARSIAKWTWDRRGSKYFKRFTINTGVMKLSKPTTTNSEDHMEQVKSNQSEGAKYAANMKRQGTKKLIDEAIAYLVENKIPVSAIEIVNVTGLSRATVYRYKDLIGKENIRAYTKFNNDILCEGLNDINKSLE